MHNPGAKKIVNEVIERYYRQILENERKVQPKMTVYSADVVN
jgi:hypothetical protein